jgi:tetratricopeptide (TPR) repeat protein
MKKILVVLILCLACSAPAAADDETHHHQDATSEQLGTVHFPTSCTESVQKSFERGVALLHSFWYDEAQKQFQQIATDDPRCAMAHWGIAMSYWHQLWNHPDKATIKKGKAEVDRGKALHSHDDREWGYIAAMDAFYGGKKQRDYQNRALAYSKAMEVAYRHHPEDLEAAAFYALSLLASVPEHDTTFSNQKKAAAILEKLFVEEPDHPGIAHYLIHSYDSPQMAELGLPAAERYAKIAPASPHALHMPSHIFARLGMWQDDINSNLASIAASRKSATMHMGGEGHEFHAMDFLEYAYLQSGREADASHLIEQVKAMPPMKDMYGLGFDPRVSALVTFPARYQLELHRWDDAAALAAVPEADQDDTAATYWARGIGHARTGHLEEARQDLAALDAIHRNLVREKKPLHAEAVEQDRQEAAAWLAHAEGRNDEAMTSFRRIAEREESEGDEPLAIPAREMLADLLLELHRPQEALTEYEADLKFNPNRFDGLYGAAKAAELAGKSEKANSYYAQLLKVCAGSSSDRPELRHARELLARNEKSGP